MRHRTGSADAQLLARLRAKGRGWVFTPADVLDLGTRDAIGSALKRMKAAGVILQLRRGIYHYPRTNPAVGSVPASSEEILAALARRDGVRFAPSSASAANLLGLSEQVPLRTVVLSDGPSRKLVLGRRQIIIRHTAPRKFRLITGEAGVIFNALDAFGPEQVDDTLRHRLRAAFGRMNRPALLRALPQSPAWMREVIEPIVAQTA